jgi:hypothetical protein
MTSTRAREHELSELLHDLDVAADVMAGVCECNPHDLPLDDLNWAVSVVDKAATLVQETLEHIKNRS